MIHIGLTLLHLSSLDRNLSKKNYYDYDYTDPEDRESLCGLVDFNIMRIESFYCFPLMQGLIYSQQDIST